jgi:hypothetical protein
MLTALFLLPLLAFAASPDDAHSTRQQYQILIDEAYQRHPALPAGLLESQAWVATRWQHRIPDETAEHRGMPPVYGLFGLYATDEYGFVDLLGEVADFNGLNKSELMASESTYVFATAAWLEQQVIDRGLEGQDTHSMRPVIEILSGISPASDASRFAVDSHVYEVYSTIGRGIATDSVSMKPQRVDLGKVFSDDELTRLGAKQVIIDDSGDTPEAKKKECFLKRWFRRDKRPD